MNWNTRGSASNILLVSKQRRIYTQTAVLLQLLLLFCYVAAQTAPKALQIYSVDVEGGQRGAGGGGGRAGLGEGAGWAGEDADVQVLEVLADGGPGGTGLGLDEAHQQ